MLTKEKPIKLVVADRCDRCYAQAKYQAVKQCAEKEYVLFFCAHHNREYGPQLIIQGFIIN
jgi:hypothetical protein